MLCLDFSLLRILLASMVFYELIFLGERWRRRLPGACSVNGDRFENLSTTLTNEDGEEIYNRLQRATLTTLAIEAASGHRPMYAVNFGFEMAAEDARRRGYGPQEG